MGGGASSAAEAVDLDEAEDPAAWLTLRFATDNGTRFNSVRLTHTLTHSVITHTHTQILAHSHSVITQSSLSHHSVITQSLTRNHAITQSHNHLLTQTHIHILTHTYTHTLTPFSVSRTQTYPFTYTLTQSFN